MFFNVCIEILATFILSYKTNDSFIMQYSNILFAIQLALFVFFIGTIVRLVFSILFDNIKTN